MDPITEWWNGLEDVYRMLLRDGGIVVGAFIAALIGSAIVRRFLVAKGVDRFLRFPWTDAPTAKANESRGERPAPAASTVTRVAGWFCGATICVFALWQLAQLHDRMSDADAIKTVMTGAWQIALVIFPALLISGWLAHTFYELLHTPWLKSEMDSLFPGKSSMGGSFTETIARALCVVIYAGFFLMIPVAVAALFNIAALETLVVPAWQVCSRLLTALVVFAVGYLGVAWARSYADRMGGEGNPDLGHQISLGLVVFTVILALGMIVGVSGFTGALVVIAFLAFLLWPVRAYLRDVWAGILLRIQRVEYVRMNGVASQVKSITPVITVMDHAGDEITGRNWDVLTAVMHDTGPAEAAEATTGSSDSDSGRQ